MLYFILRGPKLRSKYKNFGYILSKNYNLPNFSMFGPGANLTGGRGLLHQYWRRHSKPIPLYLMVGAIFRVRIKGAIIPKKFSITLENNIIIDYEIMFLNRSY